MSNSERKSLLRDIYRDGLRAVSENRPVAGVTGRTLTKEDVKQTMKDLDAHLKAHPNKLTYKGYTVYGVEGIKAEKELARMTLPDLHRARELYLNYLYNAEKGTAKTTPYVWSEKEHGAIAPGWKSPGNLSPVIELHHHRQHVKFDKNRDFQVYLDGTGVNADGKPIWRAGISSNPQYTPYLELPRSMHTGARYEILHPVARMPTTPELRKKLEAHYEEFLKNGGDPKRWEKEMSIGTITMGVGKKERERHNTWRDGYWLARNRDFIDVIDSHITERMKDQDIKPGSDQDLSARRAGRYAIETTVSNSLRDFYTGRLAPKELMKEAGLPVPEKVLTSQRKKLEQAQKVFDERSSKTQ